MTTFKPNIHYSVQFERSVIGICLLEPAAIFKVNRILSPEMFYFPQAQVIWQGICEMAAQAIPIDLITANDYFTRHKNIPNIEQHETAYTLCRLTNEVVSSAHLTYWAKVIKAMWQEREIARLRPETVGDLQQATQRLTKPVSNAKMKQYRFLLTYITKPLLRKHIPSLGTKIIRGQTAYKIRVSSPLLVLLMSIIEPKYTWTCGDHYDEQLTNDQVKQRIPANALFDGNTWIDKTQQIPIGWL